MDYTISVILDGLSSVNNRQAIIDRLYDQLSSIDQLVTGERFSTLLSILSSNNQISIPSIVNRSDFSRYLVDVAIPLNQQTDFDDKLEMDILRVLSTIDHLSSHESIMALVRQDSLIRCVMRQQADIRRQQSTEQYLRQLLNAVAIESITNHIQLDEHRNRTTKLIKQLQIVHNQLKSLSQLMNRLQSIGSGRDSAALFAGSCVRTKSDANDSGRMTDDDIASNSSTLNRHQSSITSSILNSVGNKLSIISAKLKIGR